jgi:hypothetical protein
MTIKNKHEEGEEKEETERHPLRALVYPLEVIVSPFKAFKEIAQNPEFKGFFLIIVLFIATSIGVQYVYASKIFIGVSGEQPISPTLHNSMDAYVYVTTFGNYTFKSSQPNSINYTFIDDTPLAEYSVFLVNTTETLTPVNPLVTIANNTFYQTTVDLNQSTRKVGNLTLTAKFSQYVRPKFSVLLNKTEEWNLGNFCINLFIHSPYTYLANRTTTIDLASEAPLSLLQTNAKSAELGNTSVLNDWRFSILSDWSDYGNATIYCGNHTFFTYSGTWLDVVFGVNDPKIDLTTVGITYSVLLNTYFFGDYLLFSVMPVVLTFFLGWLIYAGALFLIAKVFGEERKEEKSEKESKEVSEEINKEVSKERSSWRPFFILVGYVFSVNVVSAAVNAVLILTLPVTLADMMNATWGPLLVNQVGAYFNLLVQIWFTMLGAIAVHASRKIPWAKATMFAVIAYFIYFTVIPFIRLF